MDLETQEKISKLMREQSEKLAKALAALRRISRLPGAATGKDIATNTLKEIADYGKNPEDL